MKREYEDEITRLRDENNQLKMNGAAQVNLNQQSVDEMRMLTQRNEQSEKCVEESKRKLEETEGLLFQTELSLDESKKLNKYQMEKLTNTLERLQSTIEIAEEAFEEIRRLKHEKQQIEDESKELASTIGSVIETASMKINQEVEVLKSRHKIESEKSSMEIEGLKRLIEIERDGRSDAQRQMKLLEEKLSSLELEPLATTIVSVSDSWHFSFTEFYEKSSIWWNCYNFKFINFPKIYVNFEIVDKFPQLASVCFLPSFI